jgi:hypothetical protein
MTVFYHHHSSPLDKMIPEFGVGGWGGEEGMVDF